MSAPTTPGPVVVGIDGSDAALDAVRWAAVEAHRLRHPLRIVHSSPRPLIEYPWPPDAPTDYIANMEDQERRWLERAQAAAEQAAPSVETEELLVTGTASNALLAESAYATELVVGSRGLGGFTGMLVGSTSTSVAAHAKCPVIVVREGGEPSGPVVVGVDWSQSSDQALTYAFDVASRAGAPVEALHAWNDITLAEMWAVPPPGEAWGSFTETKDRRLAEHLATWQEKYPDVTVTRKVVQDRPRHYLMEAGQRASLLVVGSRGRGGVTGMLLGSVSRALVHHAPCPLAVVHGWENR